MTTSPILVTGAAGGRRQGLSGQGSTGYHVTRLLLERGHPVRALVHRIDERSDELKELGADVVQGDLLDIRSVRAAMAGVRRSYFAYPVDHGLVEASLVFAAAARDAGAEMVVNLSQFMSRMHDGAQRTPHQFRHWLAEQALDWAGIGAVHLNAVLFYENLRAMAGASLRMVGAVALPWGPADTRIPLICAEDVARVAAGVLTGPAVPGGTVLRLIGDVVTNQDIADAFAEMLGRPVPYVELGDEQWGQAMNGRLNDVALEHLTHLWRYFREGRPADGGEYQITTAIERIGGAPPVSLRAYVLEQRSLFAAALQPTG